MTSSPPKYTCNTCARFLPFNTYPPLLTSCCKTFVCPSCTKKNPRFASYCMLCQLPIDPSLQPSPPAYESELPTYEVALTLPPSETARVTKANGKGKEEAGVVHYIRPTDTLISLSLAYHIPLPLLRTHNSLFSDHLLPGRHTILIPSSHYTGPSLSPSPDPDAGRKSMVKRFQCRTKCVEWEVARWYLEGSGWREEEAVRRWQEDDAWERAHPKEGSGTLMR
ncbi:hypothetical protein SAICODRAFT_70234 [Saitoella complicata NRRL Y-17804]|nr:uncharacterized protein SAICODRAFT_70234 [Saitoella complicata NRRL Y-17804]ODQ54530.1 hypothetical protein SAICODRAFT_70234 [Saitoella complicata NRRL Y-17804]